MENIEEMKLRHIEEINNLQKSCKHKEKSHWMEYQYAPGHYGGQVKCCRNCGKIVDRRGY